MKNILRIITTLSLLAIIALPILTPRASFAASNTESICIGSGGTWKADNKLANGGTCSTSDGRTVMSTIQQATDVLLFITSAVAVLMIIVGGLRYTTSAGDQAAMTGAKNTITYALIGLIVSVMAYAIVHFIFGAFNIK